ncbi:MAG: sigma-54-dependent Fis family transcriptional regulator [Spirochaetales bacterium]|nr:sigma-54-dependent Fis family transcriptional regulator [Spirochaetales bacterium]
MADINYPQHPVYIVDDEALTLQSMKIILTREGINNIVCTTKSEEVLEYISNHTITLLILDLIMPGVSGEEILSVVAEQYPEFPVIIITAADEVETAVQCMKNGAFDYFVKPIEKSKFLIAVKRALQFSALQFENLALRDSLYRKELTNPDKFKKIVTNNEKMFLLFKYVEAISETQFPVLITGETGVGKELFAEAIHNLSRRQGKYIKANIAGVEDTLFSDTLFGHKKGSYTGALEDRAGLIAEAKGGTLFLDEIGELSMQCQVKLLRLLESKEYTPLGSDHTNKTDARFIAATNRDLMELVNAGKFRKDLYYRLFTHRIHIPPLKERMDDVPLLFDYFLTKVADELEKKKPGVPKEVVTLLCLYDFPGNVRELQALVYNAFSMHKKGMLSTSSFSSIINPIDTSGENNEKDLSFLKKGDVKFVRQLPTLKQAEELLISEAMRLSNNNQSIASRILGISRQALNQRLNK